MPATIATRPVHPDLPTDEVWQQGRRLYSRCARHSRLSAELHALGARWDCKEQALWVGSGKRARFEDAVLQHARRRERYVRIREAGHWIAIPYEASLIREHAKSLGAVWLREEQCWALPTPADLVEITDLVETWRSAREAERAERRRRAAQEREAQRQEREVQRRERALDEAGAREQARRRGAASEESYRRLLAERLGRTLLGPVEVHRETFPRYTTGDDARERAPRVGAVLRQADGRRVLVTRCEVRWVSAEEAPRMGREYGHWYAETTLAPLTPTEEELEEEAALARRRMDAEELHAAAVDASVLTCPQAEDRWTRVPEPVGEITVTTGLNGRIPAGQLLLAGDGTVWWQHPGHYDTYVRAEGYSRDADLARRVRALLADGPRRRALPQPEDPPLYYTVRPCLT